MNRSVNIVPFIDRLVTEQVCQHHTIHRQTGDSEQVCQYHTFHRLVTVNKSVNIIPLIDRLVNRLAGIFSKKPQTVRNILFSPACWLLVTAAAEDGWADLLVVCFAADGCESYRDVVESGCGCCCCGL